MGQCESHSMVLVTLLLLELANTKQSVLGLGPGWALGSAAQPSFVHRGVRLGNVPVVLLCLPCSRLLSGEASGLLSQQPVH